MSIEFLITSLILVATPGTGVLYTLTAGMAQGRRASLAAAFGCTLGIIPHMAAAVLGLAALLHASAVAFQGLKYLGVIYLLYMAWHTLRDQGGFQVNAEVTPRSTRQVIVSAIMVNLLNPKLSIFFLAFLPQFVPNSDPQGVPHMIGLSAVFMLLTWAIFSLYGLLAAAMRAQIIARPRVVTWLRRGFATAFVGLGINLARADV